MINFAFFKRQNPIQIYAKTHQVASLLKNSWKRSMLSSPPPPPSKGYGKVYTNLVTVQS